MKTKAKKKSKLISIDTETAKSPPVTAHFVKYKRMCIPLNIHGVSVSKRPKVKEVQELYRKFSEMVNERDHYKREAAKLEDMLRLMLLGATGGTDHGKAVMNEYVCLQHDRAHAKDVGSWSGVKWVDTNFVPKYTKPESLSVDQTSVTLDQWGDLVHATDVGRFKAKRKNKMAMKRAKR